jgi:hypothetical protein
MPTATPIARDLARRLIDREPVRQDATDPAAAAAHAACEKVFRNLSRWVGPLGSTTLFTRALLSAQRQHTDLKDVRINADTTPRPHEVGDVVQTRGSNVSAAALQAVLVELIEVLSRLIGVDVVVRILYVNVSEQVITTSDRTSRRIPS